MPLLDFSNSFETINNSITLLKMQLNTLQQQVKLIEKNVNKELKHCNKPVPVKSKKAPSGFAKPTRVTKELCEFMNRPEGTEIARTEVTKTLVCYIKDNKLQEKTVDSKNKIIPDLKLQNLLGINTDEIKDLTFFNIQKYMNKHFITKKSIDSNQLIQIN
jgi:hypothetical protein